MIVLFTLTEGWVGSDRSDRSWDPKERVRRLSPEIVQNLTILTRERSIKRIYRWTGLLTRLHNKTEIQILTENYFEWMMILLKIEWSYLVRRDRVRYPGGWDRDELQSIVHSGFWSSKTRRKNLTDYAILDRE